jgi:hypothetical protein
MADPKHHVSSKAENSMLQINSEQIQSDKSVLYESFNEILHISKSYIEFYINFDIFIILIVQIDIDIDSPEEFELPEKDWKNLEDKLTNAHQEATKQVFILFKFTRKNNLNLNQSLNRI